jgi:hypothetical protein
MVAELDLSADEKLLRLYVVNPRGWCRVSLVGETTRLLGADTKQVVARRFLDVLDAQRLRELPPPHPDAEGYRCFIMLFENHTFGYAREAGDTLELHFRDGHAKPIGDIDLTAPERERWKHQLLQFATPESK